MKRKYLLYFAFLLLPISGCGGGSTNGEAVFQTVTLDGTTADVSVDSDVAKHTLAATDPNFCSATDSITVADDVENVTVTSNLIPNLPSDVTASAVRLTQVTVSYAPADKISPPLDPQNYGLDIIVPAGGSQAIPVTLVRKSMKSSQPLVSLECSGTEFRYYVTFTFKATEVTSGVTETVPASTLNLNVSDYIDK